MPLVLLLLAFLAGLAGADLGLWILLAFTLAPIAAAGLDRQTARLTR